MSNTGSIAWATSEEEAESSKMGTSSRESSSRKRRGTSGVIIEPTPRQPGDHMWTSTKLTGEWPAKELLSLVAVTTDGSMVFVHQDRAIFVLHSDEANWRRLQLPKSLAEAPYLTIEGLFMYGGLLHVLIEKREGRTAIQTYDPSTGKWDNPIDIKKKMWCTSLTQCGSKVYSVDSWDGAVNMLDLAAKPAYKWKALTREENELLKNLGSFSLVAHRQRLYLFGGKKGATEGSNDLYCFDIKKATWYKIPNKGEVPPPRWGHSAVVAGNGFVIFGGINSMANLNDIYHFDVKKRRWKSVDALCPPPNGKCAAASWINEGVLCRVGIKTHPNIDTLYSLELEFDEADDEEIIEHLQKSIKKMRKDMKRESKKMKEELQKIQDNMSKKYSKEIKKLKKQIKSRTKSAAISEDEIIEKINKKVEKELEEIGESKRFLAENETDDTQMRENILKEVDDLISEELNEVKRELREEIEETRNQIVAKLKSEPEVEQSREGKTERQQNEKEQNKQREEERKRFEELEKRLAELESEKAEAKQQAAENAALLRELTEEVERLKDIANKPSSMTPTPSSFPETPRSSPRHYESSFDFLRIMSILGLSPNQGALEHKEVDWKNAKLIGNGAFGYTKVFQARWRSIECAVKRVKKDTLTLADLKTIQQEVDRVRNAAGLHPNILYIYGTCEPPDGGVAIVMELAPYGSVKDLLARETRLPEQLLLSLALDAAEGLQYLHEHQIPHRNIAARSVMISCSMRGLLSDFGLNKVSVHTRWMAPEMMPPSPTSPAPVATVEAWKKADIWSFGVFLWEICTGQLQRPWHGSNDSEVISSVLSGGRSLAIPPECSPTLKNIIQCCWRWNPQQRPSAEELVESLRLLLEQVSKGDARDQIDAPVAPLLTPLPQTTDSRIIFGSALPLGSSAASSPAFASPSAEMMANQPAWIRARLKQEWRKSSPTSLQAQLKAFGEFSEAAPPMSPTQQTNSKETATDKKSTLSSTLKSDSAQTKKRGKASKTSSPRDAKKTNTGGKSRKKQTGGKSASTSEASSGDESASTVSKPSPASSTPVSTSPYVPAFPSLTSGRNRSNSRLSASQTSPRMSVGDGSSLQLSGSAMAALRSDTSDMDSASSAASSLLPTPEHSPPVARRESFAPLPSFASLNSSTDGEEIVAGGRRMRSGSALSLNSSTSSLQEEPPSPPHSPRAASRPAFSPLPTKLFG